MTAAPAPAAASAGARLPRALPLVAAAATLLLRLPFAAHRLWDHDSVQFALAVADFDLAHHHPHPPGYPLYVGVLKALAAAGVSPLVGMVGLSILFQCVGAALVGVVAARLAAGGRAGAPAGSAATAAVLAATLYATGPLIWFYGELPLVYGVEAGLAVLLAWAALAMADGRRRFLLACALFGLAGGVRPSTLVLLAPLFAFGLLRAWRRRAAVASEAPPTSERAPDTGAPDAEGPPASGATIRAAPAWRPGPRDLLAGAALGAAAVAAWLVPLLAAAGGLAAYRRISGEHFATLLPHTSVLYGAGGAALAHNLEVLVKWGVQGLVPAAVVVAVAAALSPRAAGAGLRLLAGAVPFLLVWTAPAMAFFALFHVTKAGYTLVYLPALLVGAALLAAPAAPGGGRRTALAAVAVAAGAGLFLFGADRRPDQPRWLAAVHHEHNAGALEGYEDDLDALRRTLDRFPPGETLLAAVELSGTGAAGAEGFLYPYHRHLQWYAPRHPVALLVPEAGFALLTGGGRRDFERVEGTVPLPPATRRVVFVLAGPPGERLPLPPAEVVLSNGTFLVLAVPFAGELAVGRLRLVGAGDGAREEVPGRGGAAAR